MRKSYLTVLALALALSGCVAPAPQATPTATAPASTPTAAASPTAEAQIPDAEYPREARGVVTAFMTSAQLSSSAGASAPYLVPALRDRIAAGTTITSLLEVDESFQSFHLLDLEPGHDVDTAHARVALAFESRFEERAITLVREGGRWLISEVLPASGEYRTAEDYPRDPAGFVRAFLLALQTGNDPLARSFLSFDMRAQAGSQPLTTILSLPQMFQSFDVEQTPGDEQGFADVRVTLKSGGETAGRLFGLQQMEGRWHIASIMLV